ncbi:MAG: molybdopterin-synthase adenylyltransferase MoeB [Bacteroidia bacterium]
MLNEKEIKKYSRHLLLNEIGGQGQLKLKEGKVLVIGAGGLGCPVLQYLVAAGVGTIGIIDFDIIEESNLQRQVLYNEEDIGKPKANVAAEKLHKQNSLINIISYNEKLSVENVEALFNQFEIIVDCTDNFSTRYLINDACVLFGKPMIYGSIHKFQGQVSVFNFKTANKKGPTYRCVFPVPPDNGTVPSCSEIGVLGVLPGIIGMMQATEVIKMITGIGEVLSGKLLFFDALIMQSSIIEIERNPDVENVTPATIEELKKQDYNFDCEINDMINEITVEQLQLYFENEDNIQIIDVRDENELPFVDELSGLKIPLFDIENNLEKISRDKKVILYCKSGIRSAAAIQILKNEFQFNNLYNLKGGVDEWMRTPKKVSS